MDTFADAIRGPKGNGTPEGVEPGSLPWARRTIEQVKAGLKGRSWAGLFGLIEHAFR
jgi:hypothetical protein